MGNESIEVVIHSAPKKAPRITARNTVRANDRTAIYRTERGTIVKRFNVDSPRGSELFRMEVANLGRLWQEGVRCIPQLLDCGDMWFEMTNFDGGGIGGLPVELAIAIMLDVGRKILPEFQRHGYLYLDMKPSQIQLYNWRPHIVDHEHACFSGEVFRYYAALGLNQQETFGTPSYMAPETINNDRDRIGFSTMTYSWAGTMVKMASERTLFDKGSATANMKAHLHEAPRRPAAIRAEFWEKVMAPALGKDPRRRPNPAQLARLLRGSSARDVLAT